MQLFKHNMRGQHLTPDAILTVVKYAPSTGVIEFTGYTWIVRCYVDMRHPPRSHTTRGDVSLRFDVVYVAVYNRRILWGGGDVDGIPRPAVWLTRTRAEQLLRRPKSWIWMRSYDEAYVMQALLGFNPR